MQQFYIEIDVIKYTIVRINSVQVYRFQPVRVRLVPVIHFLLLGPWIWGADEEVRPPHWRGHSQTLRCNMETSKAPAAQVVIAVLKYYMSLVEAGLTDWPIIDMSDQASGSR